MVLTYTNKRRVVLAASKEFRCQTTVCLHGESKADHISCPTSGSQHTLALEFLQLGDAREIPVGALDVAGEAHDVVAVAVAPGAHHAVQHVLDVARGCGVADEEEAGVTTEGSVRHRLSHDLERLGRLKGVICNRHVLFWFFFSSKSNDNH